MCITSILFYGRKDEIEKNGMVLASNLFFIYILLLIVNSIESVTVS